LKECNVFFSAAHEYGALRRRIAIIYYYNKTQQMGQAILRVLDLVALANKIGSYHN